jgi:hypothetical protein
MQDVNKDKSNAGAYRSALESVRNGLESSIAFVLCSVAFVSFIPKVRREISAKAPIPNPAAKLPYETIRLILEDGTEISREVSLN